MKYFTLENKTCRALPFDRDLLGANRASVAKNNVFIKGLDENMTSADLEKKFIEKFGENTVKSAKVSINPDHSSRKYGFVLF